MADTNTPTLPKDAGRELGQSGTLIQNGIITAEEYNRQLIGKPALAIYDEMRRSDPNVHSALNLVKLPILAATWDVKPAEDSEGETTPLDQEAADFTRRELFNRNISFSAVIKNVLTGLEFGHSVQEKVYELTEFNGKPRIGINKIAFRKQTTIWAWQTPDGQEGITQLTPGNGQTIGIPRERLIVYSNDKEGDNYEGISLLRYCYKDWHMKSKLTLVNAVALEKLGVGIPVVQAKDNQNPTEDDIKNARAAVSNLRANEKAYLDLPASMTIEMLDLKGSTTRDVIPTLNYHKRAIYESILATFMDLGGSSGSGAKGLSSDLTSFFMKAEQAIANAVIQTITDDLIKQLCDLNFSELPNGYPRLDIGSISDDDITNLAQSVSQMAAASVLTPDPDLENHIRNVYNFPRMPKELYDQQTEKIKNPEPDTPPTPEPTTPDGTTIDDKTKEDLTPAKDGNTKAAVIQAAQEHQRKLIKVIFED